MFKIAMLGLALVTASQVQAAKYDVSDRQFEQLLDLVTRLNDKASKIEKDFGTRDVMPRERDVRDFRSDMKDLQVHSSDSVQRWIERVKKNDLAPPVVIPVLAAPADVTLTESFTRTTGFSSFFANDFATASTAVNGQCVEWRDAIKKSTVGSVVVAQCSGAEQVKLSDGNIGAKVVGQIKISFAQYTGHVAAKSATVTFSNNTGFSSYFAADHAKAAAKSKTQCDEWVAGIRANSKGLILYSSCGGFETVKGLGGNLHVSVTGTVSYTHRPSKSEPTLLNQQFTNNTGFSSYFEADYLKAATASKTQCQTWVTDTIKNSAALPVFASCSGPETVVNGNIYVKYSGQVVLLTP